MGAAQFGAVWDMGDMVCGEKRQKEGNETTPEGLHLSQKTLSQLGRIDGAADTLASLSTHKTRLLAVMLVFTFFFVALPQFIFFQ